MKIAIAGAGRMGLAIADAVAMSDDLRLAGLYTRASKTRADLHVPDDAYVGDDLHALIERTDVLIDFSLPDGTRTVIDALEKTPVPLVCGVSGLPDNTLERLRALARVTPIVYDRNMSIGVTVMSRLVRDATRALGAGFSVSIEETHHIHKQDAPSGTALKLGEQVADARGEKFDAVMHYSPDDTEPAPPGSIDFRVQRTGEVPGDHSVVFTSQTETLSLSHSVATRAVFAEGALAAARWVAAREPGFYGMHDVLFDV